MYFNTVGKAKGCEVGTANCTTAPVPNLNLYSEFKVRESS